MQKSQVILRKSIHCLICPNYLHKELRCGNLRSSLAEGLVCISISASTLQKNKEKETETTCCVGQRSTSEIPGGSLQSTAMSGTKEVNAPQKLLQYRKGYVRLMPNSPFPNAQGFLGPTDGPWPSGGANS